MIPVTSVTFKNPIQKSVYEFFIYPAYLYIMACGWLCGGVLGTRQIQEDAENPDNDLE